MACITRLGAGATCNSFGMCAGGPDAGTRPDAAPASDAGVDAAEADGGMDAASADAGTDALTDAYTDAFTDAFNDGGTDSGIPLASCLAIHVAAPTAPDGVYMIRLSTGDVAVRCLMSADGGGWTLAGNFVWPGSTAGVTGWATAARVGTDFTNLAQTFKLSDAEVNALRTTAPLGGFRAHGSAAHCQGGGPGGVQACTIDTTLFWRATCAYSSTASSVACSTAYRDVAFTMPHTATTPCASHFGLTASACGGLSTFGSSHMGNHVFVGSYTTSTHAFDGRAGEDPAIQFWVR